MNMPMNDLKLDEEPMVIPVCSECDGWTIEEHRKVGGLRLEYLSSGMFLNERRLQLYVSESQNCGVAGEHLRWELATLTLPNAALLDKLLLPINHRMVPKEWQEKYVFFWGTIYLTRDRMPCVRFMYYDRDGVWSWSYRLLSRFFKKNHYAVTLAT